MHETSPANRPSANPSQPAEAASAESVSPGDVPFAEVYRGYDGVRFAPWRGVLAPADYGDAEHERRVLLEGCGVVDASGESALVVAGEDRLRFLEGQITCHVGGVADGGGTYGFFVSAKGRVESDLRVLGVGERLWLAFPPGRRQAMRERLEKYVIVDRVSFEDAELHPLRLVGPKAEDVLAGLGIETPAEPLQHRGVTALGGVGLGDARLVRETSLRLESSGTGDAEMPVFALWLTAGRVPAVLEALVGGGAELVGHRAFDAVRIAAGLPLYGIDFADDCFPQETGLGEAGVSYTKGCYLGQEVVARIHYRGGVQRTMRRVRLSVERDVLPGSSLLRGGKVMGKISSIGRLGDSYLGLAVVHRKAESGTDVEVRSPEGEALGSARLEDLAG